jgi:hypothetical protein
MMLSSNGCLHDISRFPTFWSFWILDMLSHCSLPKAACPEQLSGKMGHLLCLWSPCKWCLFWVLTSLPPPVEPNPHHSRPAAAPFCLALSSRGSLLVCFCPWQSSAVLTGAASGGQTNVLTLYTSLWQTTLRLGPNRFSATLQEAPHIPMALPYHTGITSVLDVTWGDIRGNVPGYHNDNASLNTSSLTAVHIYHCWRYAFTMTLRSNEYLHNTCVVQHFKVHRVWTSCYNMSDMKSWLLLPLDGVPDAEETTCHDDWSAVLLFTSHSNTTKGLITF